MLTFLHAADFHLDAPFAALPPERAAQRRGEQRELLDRMAQLARDRQVDLVLLAGDLMDSEQTYAEAAQALSRALAAIPAPVFIAPGNHDFWSEHSLYATMSWPENVHIFTQAAPSAVPLPQLGCTVYGAAFTAPGCDRSPLEQFCPPADGSIHLMVLHALVEGRNYAPITRAQIAASGLTYLALGHVHAYSGPQIEGRTVWAYPGCPEGRGFDETGDKGVLLGTIDQGRVDLEFVPLAQRRYRIETVDITEVSPEQALADLLPATPSPDLCRILFTGERGEEGLDLAALEAQAARCFYSVSLRDHTRVRRDLWDRAEEDTLTGLFLRDLRARLEGAENEEDRALVERAVRFGLAALEHGEDPFL